MDMMNNRMFSDFLDNFFIVFIDDIYSESVEDYKDNLWVSR